jgi:hypothetical protein
LIIVKELVYKGKKVAIGWDPKLKEIEVDVPRGKSLNLYDEIEVEVLINKIVPLIFKSKLTDIN